MPAATYYWEADFDFDGYVPLVQGFELFETASEVPSLMGGGQVNFVGASSGWTGTWYPNLLNAALGNNVPHTFHQAHTPLVESTDVDGIPWVFDPSQLGGYVPYMAGLNARYFYFGVHSFSFVAPGIGGKLYSMKIGSVPGGDDYLRWNALTDGFGPFTVAFGTANLVGDHIEFPQPLGGTVLFDFVAPWPPPIPAFTFQCSFSVGVTNVMRMTPNLPPPDDKVLVQAALPETLLPEGYRIEVGVYNPDGTPFTASTERDTTLAFKGLDDEDDGTE